MVNSILTKTAQRGFDIANERDSPPSSRQDIYIVRICPRLSWREPLTPGRAVPTT